MQPKRTEGRTTKTTALSGGWYMAEPMTRSMAMLMYNMLDAEELDELDAVRMDKDDFVNSILSADRSAAFFNGAKLMFSVAANWVELDGKTIRLWDTMSTKTVRECGLGRSFAVHTQEMLDAFIIGEPTDEVYGIVKSDFARSRKWIERCAKFEECGHIGVNNIWHTIYRHNWNNNKGE